MTALRMCRRCKHPKNQHVHGTGPCYPPALGGMSYFLGSCGCPAYVGAVTRNPRPCECGHLEGSHFTLYGQPGRCRPCLGRLTQCFAFRSANRKEPLRAPDRQISERKLRKFLNDEIRSVRSVEYLLTTDKALGIVRGRVFQAKRIREQFCVDKAVLPRGE